MGAPARRRAPQANLHDEGLQMRKMRSKRVGPRPPGKGRVRGGGEEGRHVDGLPEGDREGDHGKVKALPPVLTKEKIISMMKAAEPGAAALNRRMKRLFRVQRPGIVLD